MKKLQEKIMTLRFRRAAKLWVILALALALIGGGACAALLAPQIGEAVAYARTADEQESAQAAVEVGQATDGEHGGELRRFAEKEHRDWENIPFTEPSTAAKAAVGVTGLLALVLGAGYWLACAAWVWRAAVRSGMNGTMWLVLALVGNLAAVVLFWAVRSVLRTKCPQCGTWQRKGHYCASCGAELVHYCPTCKSRISVQDLYCRHCGVLLKAEHMEAVQG